MARGIKTPTRTAQAPKEAARSTAKPATAKENASASKATAAKAPVERAPVMSKDELRSQVEKLQQTNATLRTKSREANRAAKAATARIAELEEEVATLEKQVASQASSAKRSATRSAGRKSRDIDPGDSVPEGVAVAEPEPLDQEAGEALENLEEHLGESGGDGSQPID
jgi:chromosome segregation ATPase